MSESVIITAVITVGAIALAVLYLLGRQISFIVESKGQDIRAEIRESRMESELFVRMVEKMTCDPRDALKVHAQERANEVSADSHLDTTIEQARQRLRTHDASMGMPRSQTPKAVKNPHDAVPHE